MRAELEAIVCSGPLRGKHHTYAALAERAPRAKRLRREDALSALAERYFATRGPATLNDYTWWSGLTARQAREGIEALGSRLETVVVDGRTYWFVPGEPPPKGGSASADLVQVYDEVVIGYRQSRDLLISRSLTNFASGASILHPILHLGRLIGRWKPLPGEEAVKIEPFRTLSETQRRATARAVARFRGFVEAGAAGSR
jgi:hypothetical protein